MDSSGQEQGSLAGSCEHGKEPSGSREGGEFLDQLSDYQSLKKDSAPCGSLHRSATLMPKLANEQGP
jgi:hypothetical protein